MNRTILHPTPIGLRFGPINWENQLGYPLTLSYLVVIIGLEGEADVTLNFKDYTLKKGALLVLSSDIVTLIQRTSSNFNAQCYAIDRPLASEIAYQLSNQLFGFLHDNPLHFLNKDDQQQLTYWNKQLLYILIQSSSQQQKIVVNHFQNLFLRMTEYMEKQGAFKQRKFSRQEEMCWKFWDLIGQYAKTHREVAFYANQLHITPFYLAQISKKYLNDQPKDLINRQVILEIKNLLQTTNKSIGEIAEVVHFDDPSYMGRFFRRETGFSMSEYRKS
ncbi:helix-turn-helix domain-containing protein [Myroides sp. DW712]|uniref:helix-turn-helix domain-containing protein n=1 Tax=Myroides sp. DW712 TaxID=3389800 RepID=UPI003978ABD3